MTYEMILKRYNHLTDDELREEIRLRSTHRYDTRMVGADGCATDANVIRACRELLDTRGTMTKKED